MKKFLLLFILLVLNNMPFVLAEEEVHLDFSTVKKHTINNNVQNPNKQNYNDFDYDEDDEDSLFDDNNNIPRDAMPPSDSLNNIYANPQTQLYNGLFR